MLNIETVYEVNVVDQDGEYDYKKYISTYRDDNEIENTFNNYLRKRDKKFTMNHYVK